MKKLSKKMIMVIREIFSFTMPEIKNYLSNLNMKVMHDKIVPEEILISVIAQK